MQHQFSVEYGQPHVLATLAKKGVPSLSGQTYETHAPYDALAVFDTLFMNSFAGARRKRFAVNAVTHLPNEALEIVSVLDKPVSRLIVGNGAVIRSARPVGSLVVRTTPLCTEMSFLGVGEDMNQPVLPTGMSKEDAFDAAKGIVTATMDKLIDPAFLSKLLG